MRLAPATARTLALVPLLAAAAGAQSAPPAPTTPSPSAVGAAPLELRSRGEARVRSWVLPGWGHLYAGERARGATLIAVSLTSTAVFAVDCAANDCWGFPSTATGGIAFVTAVGTSVYAFVDAGRAVDRHNAAARARAAAHSAGVYVAPAPGGARVGFRVPLAGGGAR